MADTFIVGQRVVSLATNLHGRRGFVVATFDSTGNYAVRVRFDGNNFVNDHAAEFLQDEGDYDAAQQRKAEADELPEDAGGLFSYPHCPECGSLTDEDDNCPNCGAEDWPSVAAEYDRTVEEGDFARYADYMLPFRLANGATQYLQCR